MGGEGEMANKNLVPLVAMLVVREGRRVPPPIGKAFPFTDEEVKVLREGVDYRKAVNEDEEADLASVMAERNSPHVTRAKTNAAGAGKTTAMVNGADGAQRTGEQGNGTEGDARLKGNATDTIALVGGLDDKADLAALREAEVAAGNRSTVLKAIDARVAALTTDDDL
jgi:hypothetical protein